MLFMFNTSNHLFVGHLLKISELRRFINVKHRLWNSELIQNRIKHFYWHTVN